MLRLIMGFLVAPVIGVLLAVFIVFGREVYSVLWVYLILGSAIAYASALLFGLPGYLVMKRFTKLAWWQVALAGGLCGIPYWLISEYPYTSAYFKNQGLTNLLLYVIAGVVAGLAFWLITRKSDARPSL
jgi:hypothetical protein